MKNRVLNYVSLSLLTLVVIIVVVLLRYRSSRNDTAKDQLKIYTRGVFSWSSHPSDRNSVGYWASEESSPEVKTGEPPSMDSVEQKSRVSVVCNH